MPPEGRITPLSANGFPQCQTIQPLCVEMHSIAVQWRVAKQPTVAKVKIHVH
jgi:hypothetical protein